jgi:hypothetical protein
MNGGVSVVRQRGFKSDWIWGWGLNFNVARSFAVVMILKGGLQPVKLPLFSTKQRKSRITCWRKFMGKLEK